MCVFVDASLAKVPSAELVLRELGPGTILLVEEFPEGVSFACRLNSGLVLCSEFAVSLEVESLRAEDIISKGWVVLP